MQIALELRNGKEKIARFQAEVKEGEKNFHELVNSLNNIIYGDFEVKKFEEKVAPEEVFIDQAKKELSVSKHKKYVPEVISDEVIVHDEILKHSEQQREIMLVAICECGNGKVFKTLENAGKKFRCDCGKEYRIENSIPIEASCPNCGNVSRGFRTLPGMDVSEFLRCKKCESPIDLKYNKKENIWCNL